MLNKHKAAMCLFNSFHSKIFTNENKNRKHVNMIFIVKVGVLAKIH